MKKLALNMETLSRLAGSTAGQGEFGALGQFISNGALSCAGCWTQDGCHQETQPWAGAGADVRES